MRTCSVCRRMSASAGPHCPRDGAPTVDGPAPEFAPGSKVFGRFEIGEAVARGGTGTIYRARDEAGGQVALKVLHADLTKSPVDRSRVKRDLVKATTVLHAAIVRVREVGETESRIFLVREFVEGDALKSLLRRDGPFELPRAARVVHALAEALVEAHRAGVLHRDINARHVIVQLDGSPALIDFALSAPIPGGIAGKPAFGSIESLAPEQAAGKLVTLRADLYSLGLLLRELLTGGPVALPDDPAAALASRAEADAPPAPPGVPPAIAALLGQLLARDPKDRPFGARAVEKALVDLSRTAAPRATTAPIKPIIRYAQEDGASAPPVRAPRKPSPRGATLPMKPVIPEPPPAPSEPPAPEPAPTQPYPTLPDDAKDVASESSLERQLDDALQVVARGKERKDSTAVLGSDAPATRTPLPATRPPGPSRSMAPTPPPPPPRPRPPAARTPAPAAAEAPAGRPGPLPRTAKKTLIGIPLPDAADPSTAVRQKWARNVLGLAEGEGAPPARASAALGLPATLEPPRRAATAQGTGAAPPVPARTPHPPARSQEPTPPPPLPDEDVFTFDTPAPKERAATEPMGAPPMPWVQIIQETEAEQLRLEQLEAAASALAPPTAEPYPPVPAMPTDVPVLAPRALGGPDEASITDAARAFRSRGGSRTYIYVGAGGLAVALAIGLVLALTGGSGPPTPPRPPAPAPAPPSPPPTPVAAPPVAVPVPALPVLVDGGAVAIADAGAPPALDAAAPLAPDGGTTVAAATDGGAPPVADGGPAAAVPPPPLPPPPPPAAVPDDDPRDTSTIIKFARANVRRRHWPEARRAFDVALRREPTNLDALLGAALVAVSERRHPDALRHFQTAVQQRPDNATLHVYLGNAHLMNDDRASAEREWRRALELDPTHREARMRLGIARGAPRPPPSTTKAPTKRPGTIRRNPYR